MRVVCALFPGYTPLLMRTNQRRIAKQCGFFSRWLDHLTCWAPIPQHGWSKRSMVIPCGSLNGPVAFPSPPFNERGWKGGTVGASASRPVLSGSARSCALRSTAGHPARDRANIRVAIPGGSGRCREMDGYGMLCLDDGASERRLERHIRQGALPAAGASRFARE